MQNKFRLQGFNAYNFDKNEMKKTLKEKVLKSLLEVSEKALRDPRTHRELVTRKRWNRLKYIWEKRYETD
jgi:hypothetical protein